MMLTSTSTTPLHRASPLISSSSPTHTTKPLIIMSSTAFAPPLTLSPNPLTFSFPKHNCRPSRQPSRTFITISQIPAPSSTPPPAPIIQGTPCFTPHIMATPMPRDSRQVYLQATADSLRAYLSNFQPSSNPLRAKLTLLPPQLNPELDVYDRRFLLQLVWASITVAASLNLRTRVLIQGPRNFGAVPLSIAGLKRNFDADLALSIEDWPVLLRSGELENPDDVDNQDDLIVIVSPTNAVSIPVITSIEQLVQRVPDKPIVLLNPRLSDVPSHSGVMQTSGRADRIAFMQTFEDIFYMRLLFKSGTSYPLRGILYHAYPGPWQVWRSLDHTTDYNLILSSQNSPPSEDINRAFSRDTYNRQKARLKQSNDQLASSGMTAFLTSPQMVIFVGAAGLLATTLLVKNGDIPLLMSILSGPFPK